MRLRAPWRTSAWPVIGSAIFWFGAVAQIAEILVRRDATSVSITAWLLYAVVLLGYAGFYSEHLEGNARRFAVVSSVISASLYLVIVALTVVYS